MNPLSQFFFLLATSSLLLAAQSTISSLSESGNDSTYFIFANQSNHQHATNTSLESLLTNDDECQGNRFEALESGRQCLKRCRKDVQCENSRKHCLCDGLCGWSCIKPDSSCLELPKIANGRYSPQLNTFKTRVTYDCDDGFYLFGSRERVCQGDEEWSGTSVECLSERKSFVNFQFLKTKQSLLSSFYN